MQVIIQSNNLWLRFADPVRILRTTRLDRVMPLLKEAETSGLYAAGFLSYEAAPAFDSALKTHPTGDFPLLCFGLFDCPQYLEKLPDDSGKSLAMGSLRPSLSPQKYRQTIRRIHEKIARGETYQVNYTYRLRADFTGDPYSFFRQFVNGQQLAHAAYVDAGDFAVCSASPELFFTYANGEIVSRPMKGTADRGRTLMEDREQAQSLLGSEKDRAENIMIVDMIRNDIGRIAVPGSVRTPQTFALEKYPTVWQMTSTVKGKTRVCISEVFKALFPCASITGAPKAKTMEIIRDLEPGPRGVYTGCVGFMDPQGEASFNVAIRTALIDRTGQSLEYGVGGGIVWDSDPEKEFEETLIKARVLTRPRADFKLLETLLFSPAEGFFLLDEHVDRLARSAEYFGFSVDLKEIKKGLEKTRKSCGEGSLKVRLLVSKNGEFTIQTAPLNSAGSATGMPVIQVAVSEQPVDSKDVFLYHKTTCRAVYQAALDAFPEVDDVILWNERGEVTESCIANVVIRRDGQWVTPPVTSGLLAGTFREYLLAQGKVTEAVVSLDDLKKADEIFLINSVRRWRKAVLFQH